MRLTSHDTRIDSFRLRASFEHGKNGSTHTQYQTRQCRYPARNVVLPRRRQLHEWSTKHAETSQGKSTKKNATRGCQITRTNITEADPVKILFEVDEVRQYAGEVTYGEYACATRYERATEQVVHDGKKQTHVVNVIAAQ
jgi:hypothetical protein